MDFHLALARLFAALVCSVLAAAAGSLLAAPVPARAARWSTGSRRFAIFLGRLLGLIAYFLLLEQVSTQARAVVTLTGIPPLAVVMLPLALMPLLYPFFRLLHRQTVELPELRQRDRSGWLWLLCLAVLTGLVAVSSLSQLSSYPILPSLA